MDGDETATAGTVLLVDDEPQLLRLMARVFTRAGYRVLEAPDGDRALAICEDETLREQIDVVVLDVIIPPAGAAPVVEGLLARRPDLGLVLVSGDQPPAALTARLEAHGGIFLRKPFAPRALLESVASLRAGSRS